jgi:hypothetical protein
MYKVPKGKVRISVLIRKEIADRLWELIKMKYERPHGMLSYEVEQALQAWLAAHTRGAQVLATKANPQPRAVRVWEEVKRYLREQFGYVCFPTGTQVPREHIIRAIAAIRGDDERTIRKWLERFQRYHLLKQISFDVFEVI